MSLKVKQAILKVRQMLCLGEAVHYGSISKAAEKNAMKQSNFSVQIKQLEEEIGEQLILRLPHGVKLTEAGQKLYTLVCDLDNVLNKVSSLDLKVFHVGGAIRLWTSDGLGIGYLSECLSDFYTRYPRVNVEILCSLEMPKPDQFDMAIVYSEPKDKTFKIVDKFDLQFSLYASRKYLSVTKHWNSDILKTKRIFWKTTVFVPVITMLPSGRPGMLLFKIPGSLRLPLILRLCFYSLSRKASASGFCPVERPKRKRIWCVCLFLSLTFITNFGLSYVRKLKILIKLKL